MASEIGPWWNGGGGGGSRGNRNEGRSEFDERQWTQDDAAALPRPKGAAKVGGRKTATKPATGARKNRDPPLAVSRHENRAARAPGSSDRRHDIGGLRHDRHDRNRDGDEGGVEGGGDLDRARPDSRRRASPATAAQFAHDSKRTDKRTASSRSGSRTATSVAAADRASLKKSRRKLIDDDADGGGGGGDRDDDRAASKRQPVVGTVPEEDRVRERKEHGEDERFFESDRVAPEAFAAAFAAAAGRVGTRKAASSKRAPGRKLPATRADARLDVSAPAPTVRHSATDVPPPPPSPSRNASKTASRVQVEEPHTVWNQLRKFINHLGATSADDGDSEVDDRSGTPKKRRKKLVAPQTGDHSELASGDQENDDDDGDRERNVQWKDAPAAEPPRGLRQRWRDSAVDVWRRPQTRILVLLAAAWLVNLQRVCCDAAVGLAYPLYASYVVLRRVRVAHVHVGTLELWLIYLFLYAIWTCVADQLVYFFGGSFAPIYHVLKAAALAALYLPGGWRGALWSTASRRRAFDADRGAFARWCFESIVVRAVAGGERVAARLFGSALNVEVDDASHLSVIGGGGGGGGGDSGKRNDEDADDDGVNGEIAAGDGRDPGANQNGTHHATRSHTRNSTLHGRLATDERAYRSRRQPALTLPPRQATDWDSLHARDLEATLDDRSRNLDRARQLPQEDRHRGAAAAAQADTSGAASSFSDMVRSQLSAAVGNIAHATVDGIAQRARESRPELVTALGLFVNGGRGGGGERDPSGAADANARRSANHRVPDAHRYRPGTDDEA